MISSSLRALSWLILKGLYSRGTVFLIELLLADFVIYCFESTEGVTGGCSSNGASLDGLLNYDDSNFSIICRICNYCLKMICMSFE